ncbi:hypothetical protein BP6252_07486 [Coleophoma cylindrospora]|uniref:Transcription factor domain-containing protein n=1 Tax=Coleophoma cylindrospora TaxID=1849047 RepID=A0A3D8RHP8_9HELO|nr:hypothetical protein BP6252_07486 [Coleophoma cylindrospora]
MLANEVGFVPNLTFVSMTGPTLDNSSAKAMRAHTTRANFARRRLRLVREYSDLKDCAPRVEPPQVEEDGQTTDHDQVVDIQLPIFSHPGLDTKLNGIDAFFINHLTQAMEKLHLVTNIPASDTTLAVMQSDWARFLPDPTMLDVSLYFARHVYAARRHYHAAQFVVDTYKGKAIRSVRERLNDGYNGLSDSLVAAILILTVLDQVLGNIEAWKIHISGLFQIITVRSRNSNELPTYWISNTIPRTILQGLLRFTRHDATLLTMIEKTGIFDIMFSAPAKKAAYLILANVEQVDALHYTYGRGFQKYGCSADGSFTETRAAVTFFFGTMFFLGVGILANNDGCNRCSRCWGQIVLYIEAQANNNRFSAHILARCLDHFAKILLDTVYLLCPELPDIFGSPLFARLY